MKINPVILVVAATAFFAIKSFAATKTLEFKDIGTDGKACSAQIAKDRKGLIGIQHSSPISGVFKDKGCIAAQ